MLALTAIATTITQSLYVAPPSDLRGLAGNVQRAKHLQEPTLRYVTPFAFNESMQYSYPCVNAGICGRRAVIHRSGIKCIER